MWIQYIAAAAGAIVTGIPAAHFAQWFLIIGSEDDFPEGISRTERRQLLLEKGEQKPLIWRTADFWTIICLNILLWFVTLTVYGFSWNFLIYGIASGLMLSLSRVDIGIQEIPPVYNVLLGAAALIHLFIDRENWLVYLIGSVVISGLFLIIGLISSGGAMGGGDVKLMVALGLLLGWKKVILATVVACISGALLHTALMLLVKKGRALAFGPYLCAGAMVAIYWGDRLLAWYLGTMQGMTP